MPASKRSELVIETYGLSKKYRDTFAVRDLDLAVPAGSISAFLGPNGSGKTTTIRMLLGLAHPTAGVGRVLGQAISDEAACIRIRLRIGYVGEDKRLYGYMTVREILDFVRPLFPAGTASGNAPPGNVRSSAWSKMQKAFERYADEAGSSTQPLPPCGVSYSR